MIKNIKVTAVNKPHGTLTVMWNEDPELEWNYNIPFDDAGKPLEGDELLRYLIVVAYDHIRSVYEGREEQKKRDKADFKRHDGLLRKKFDLKEMVDEFERIREAEK